MKNYSKLKKAFADDPEVLRQLAHEEMMQGIKEKNAVEIAMLIKKGDKGDTPKKGVDYFTKEEVKDIAEYVKDTVKEEVRPRKGKDYFDGAPGRPGKDADETKILKRLMQEIPTAGEILAQVKVPEPKEIDQEELINKILKAIPEPKILTFDEILKEFKKKPLLDLRDIKGARLDGRLNGASGNFDMNDQRWHGGGLSTVATDGVTITGDGTPGNPLVAVSGASAFTDLTDVPHSYAGQAGLAVYVNAAETGLEFKAAVSTDEKVKLDAADPTAGYLDAKLQEGIQQVAFDLTPSTTIGAGKIQWNAVDGTFDMGMLNGSVLQVGQEIYFYGKADGAIANGEVCEFAGVEGDHIKFKKAVGSEIDAAPHYLVGVATNNIANGNFGYVTWFGKINGVYTKTPANGDTADWIAGDILYFSKTTGQLTKTMPSAPDTIISVAAVIKIQTGASENGVIIVRPQITPKLSNLSDVDGTPLSASGQILVWNNTAGYWDATANINDYSKTDEKVKYDASDPTASYLSEKIVAGTGISVAEGTGGNENKLVITNSAPFVDAPSDGNTYGRKNGAWSSISAGGGDMILNAVQTVTGLKTFDKDKLAMLGTSTGVNTISVANTSATSYTNIIPAKDGTFAMTSDIPDVTGFLKLDQTTPQSIINGSPKFTAGLNAGSSDQLDIDNFGNVTTSGWENNLNFATSAHYTGFPRPATTTLSWNDGTYTLTLTASGDKVWINGVEYTINTLTKQLTVAQEAVSGLYWFWITAPLGVPQLNCDITPPGFDKCLVASAYWNTTTNKGFVADERHWMGRDQWWHEYTHETIGARYAGGMTGTFNNTTFTITDGEFYDEDIEHVLGSNITTARVMYHNGDSDWAWDILTTPYKVVNPGVDNTLRYNNGNNLASVGVAKYVNYWIFATGDQSYPIQIFLGTAEYNTLAGARAATPPSFGNLPTAENKLIWKITYQNNSGTPAYQESIDYRSATTLPNNSFIPTDHGTLTGLTDLDHPASAIINTPAGNISATTVQAAIDELDAEKATIALSNLSSVAINTTLVSDTDNTDALGTAAISWSDLFLGNGAVITWSSAPNTADITLTHSANTLTLAGGDLIMATSLGSTGTRVLKGWFTDLEVTNAITGSITGNAGTASAVAVGGITGLGTGVATALAVNVGTAGSVVVNGGALGTPSSGTVTNLTGTASININGTVGATTPTTGVFTTVTTNTGLIPDVNDGAYLGQAGTAFSDLFLASGAVINWDSGNATLTHSAGLMTLNVPLSVGTGFRIGGVAGSNKILKGNGTNFVESTETYAAPGASGNVMTSDGTNWTSAALTAITATGVATLTNKRITKRVGSESSSATPTINTDNYDIYKVTAQAGNITSFTTNLSGTPVDGDTLQLRIKAASNSANAITYVGNAVFDSAAATTAIVTPNASTAIGDLMLALITTTGAISSVPPGWTLYLNSGASISNLGVAYVYYRVATIDDIGTAVSWTLGSAKVRLTVSTFRGGFNIDNPFDASSNTQYKTNDAPLRAASFSVTRAYSPIIFLGAASQSTTLSATAPTNPGNFTEDSDGWNANSDMLHYVAHYVWASTGATGNIDATLANIQSDKHAFAISLNPIITVTHGTSFVSNYSSNPLLSYVPIDGVANEEFVYDSVLSKWVFKSKW